MARAEFPLVDIAPLVQASDAHAQATAARLLVEACHRYGFVTITGHGVPADHLESAFSLLKDLFSLSHEDKMKAPHPETAVPHRGYSAPGLEKVYAAARLDEEEVQQSNGESLRKITDFKESYEVGSEHNRVHTNIWLPEQTFPGFKKAALELYWELNDLSRLLLKTLASGLNLTEHETEYLLEIHSGHNNQLRLLHYPPVPAEKLQKEVLARMPAHTDWSFFTLLFQDNVGGLELEDPQTPGLFLAAKPEPGSLVLNIGDMFMRLTNGYFPSATHRVSIPPIIHTDPMTKNSLTPERYSIPYFVAPDDSATIETFRTLIPKGETNKFETIKFEDYANFRAKHSYRKEGQGFYN